MLAKLFDGGMFIINLLGFEAAQLITDLPDETGQELGFFRSGCRFSV
jgi:hypothetical protein